jgi:hypothetical protein
VQFEAANGRIHPASFGINNMRANTTNRRQSCLPVKNGSTIVDAGNVCIVAEKPVGIAVRTPCL